jgi:tetratricopeptide (TPR) repeat protein
LLLAAAWFGSRAGLSSDAATVDRSGAGLAVGGETTTETERQLYEAVARHPEDARARERLGSHYLSTGRPYTALWELQEARALAPDDPATGLGLADALAAARFLEAAMAELRGLLERHPGRADLCRRLADLSLMVGRPESAIAALRRARDLDRSPEALLVLAQAHHSLKQYDQAARALQAAGRLLPTTWQPSYRLGRLYLERGDSVRAEQAFLAAGASTPDRPEPHYGLGLTYLRGRGEGRGAGDAEAAFRTALRLSPEYAPAHRELGRLLLSRREYREAGEHLLRAIRAAKDAEACRAMAEALAAVGRHVESRYYWGIYFTRKDLRPRAAAAFQAMAALDPQRSEAALLLTETYIRMNQEQRGIGVIKAALRRHPRESALYERLATLYIATIDRPDAARICREWLRRHPEAAAPHWVLGRIMIETPKVEEGLRELELAVAREPENPEFAYTLAAALLGRATPENEERAVRLLEEVIRKAPAVARYRNQLGLALRQQGDRSQRDPPQAPLLRRGGFAREGARQQFLRSLDLDPHQAPVCSNLVAVASQLGLRHQVRFWAPLVRAVENRTREELRLWRAVWDHPDDASACYRLAGFLVRTGELTKAQSQLEEGLRLRPDWPEAKALLERVSGAVRAQVP